MDQNVLLNLPHEWTEEVSSYTFQQMSTLAILQVFTTKSKLTNPNNHTSRTASLTYRKRYLPSSRLTVRLLNLRRWPFDSCLTSTFTYRYKKGSHVYKASPSNYGAFCRENCICYTLEWYAQRYIAYYTNHHHHHHHHVREGLGAFPVP